MGPVRRFRALPVLLAIGLALHASVLCATASSDKDYEATLKAVMSEGSPTGPLTLLCRQSLVGMFSSEQCIAANIASSCTTISSTIFQWRLLCMSGVMAGKIDEVLKPQQQGDHVIDWSTIHPGTSTYLDLWVGPDGLGPVGKAVTEQHHYTAAMVLDLASSTDLEAGFQGAVAILAANMNMQHEVPDVPPASIRVAPSSLPGGPAQASCLHECAPVHVQQQDNPFDIMTIPIVGDHPLQNFARYQTVYVTQSGSGASKQYTYKSPPMNAFAIDVSNKEWLSAMVRSPGLLAEGFDFKMVYSASSAADAMSVKAEAFFNGWGVGVSAEVTKQETSASMKSGIFFDYWIKKVWSPDPSNLMEFGVPLGTALKKELADALRNRSLEQFYAKWGNFFILGFTRVVRFSSKIGFDFKDMSKADTLTTKAKAEYKGFGISAGGAVDFAKQNAMKESGASLQATRDVLPVGYQDAEAYKAAQGCTLPDILKSPEGITDGWVKETGTMLAGCGRGVGVPTATQGDRTHAMLVPLAYLREFQEVVQAVQDANQVPPIPPIPVSLLTDIDQVASDPYVTAKLQVLWARAKTLQRASTPYVGLNASEVQSVYRQVGAELANLGTNIKRAVAKTPCDVTGCEGVIQALNRADLRIVDLDETFSIFAPIFRDAVRIRDMANEVRRNADIKFPAGTDDHTRLTQEATQISQVAELLTKGFSTSTAWSGNLIAYTEFEKVDPGAGLIMDVAYTDTFNRARYAETNSFALTFRNPADGPFQVFQLGNVYSITVPDGVIATFDRRLKEWDSPSSWNFDNEYAKRSVTRWFPNGRFTGLNFASPFPPFVNTYFGLYIERVSKMNFARRKYMLASIEARVVTLKADVAR